MKFTDFPYTRPDAEAYKSELAALTAQLSAAGNFAEADDVFLRQQTASAHFSTAATLAHIRHDIDTRDAFYDAENDFFDGVEPELEEYVQAWNGALLASPFRGEFERKYNRVFLLNAELSRKAFSPELIPELQRENALTSEYSKLLASAQIPFEGKTYTLAQLTLFRQDPDDARRLAAWKAEGAWYKAHQPRLDAIYDELVKLRDGMAKKLGCADYTPMGYWRMQRNCYTRTDVEKFRAAVRRYVVPLAAELYRGQAKRLGKEYPLSFADAALTFRSGNARPVGAPEEILEEARRFYHWLSPETGAFIDVMLDNGLMEVLAREGKAPGGYSTGLLDYKLPFVFANFNGTSEDVETVTHEAGHAFADWTNRNIVPAESIYPSLEACEVHSMSMEFFAWAWAEKFYGADARKFRYAHLSDDIWFLPYGTMVDHFQHEVYDHPDMTPAQRHALWKRLLGEYMPWLRLDGDIPFYADGEGWQRQTHIYEDPFYYIDYCLAVTMAMQLWALSQQDLHQAWEKYMAYTRHGGTKTFTELIDCAGLESPFGDECLRFVCETAAAWLRDYDLSGIE